MLLLGLAETSAYNIIAYVILHFVISYVLLVYVEMGMIVVKPARDPYPLQFQRWSEFEIFHWHWYKKFYYQIINEIPGSDFGVYFLILFGSKWCSGHGYGLTHFLTIFIEIFSSISLPITITMENLVLPITSISNFNLSLLPIITMENVY